MAKNIIITNVIFVLFVNYVLSFKSNTPTWLTSPYFKSGYNQVITQVQGNASSPTYTFIFSSVFPSIPKLAYGIKCYRGMDTLLNQMFEIQRVSLTKSTFTVSMTITGLTNIYLLTVPYIAIDPAFPHHLNSFDNVALNYSSGPLTNFSTNVSQVFYFTQVIDYTSQSQNNTFKTFQYPLSSNKIVIFLTSLYIKGTGLYNDPPNWKPIQLDVNYTILNTSHYSWTARLYQNCIVTKLRFSQIVYNQNDIASSNTYAIGNSDFIVTSKGGFQSFPEQLVTNMIMALVDFRVITAQCVLDYNWYFVTNYQPGVPYGIFLNASVPVSPFPYGLDKTRSTIFYIKTWKCGQPYVFFNITTDLCQDGCGYYYYQNNTSSKCLNCSYQCMNCSQPGTSNSCTLCQATAHRTLINSTCTCNVGYYDDGYASACRSCATVDSHCINCSYTLNSSKSTFYYQGVFASTTWQTDIKPNYTCYNCMSNYFINSVGVCQTCSISYCLTCQSITTCSICNSTASAKLSASKKCYICTGARCVSCSSTNFCQSCLTGYFVISGICTPCNESCTCEGWTSPKNASGVCSTICGDGYLRGAEACDDNNTVNHDGCSSTCTIQSCAQNCSCDGWIKPWINSTCSTTCGDGFLRGYEQCDDGNTNSHDGCSSICLNQSCNQSCKCDGWTTPWTNNSCNTICGDSLIRGQQSCDDGNTINFDGCSFSCQTQACSVSCLCDGWVLPHINNTCSTICGDKITIGQQQCDQGNMNGNGDCSINCTINKKQQILILQPSATVYPALIFFVLGFKIVGLQMLNILQNFQLILQTYRPQSIQISYQVHGYSDPNNFPLKISSDFNVLTKFNFMFVLILVFFVIFLITELCIYRKKSTIKNKISNQNQLTTQHEKNSETESDSHDDNFQVHYKQRKNQTSNSYFKNNSQIQPNSLQKTNVFFRICIIISRQVFFNLLINCVSIIAFSLAQQIQQFSVKSIVNTQSLIVICTVTIFISGLLYFYRSQSLLFGENQLKFNNGKWMIYWAITTLQKNLFSALLGYQVPYCLYMIASLKFLSIIYFMADNVFFRRIQKTRNLILQILHFFLIGFVIFSIEYFKGSGIQQSLPQFIIEYINLSIIGLIILITIGFYIRQVIYYFSADQRVKIFVQICPTQSNGSNIGLQYENMDESSHPFNNSKNMKNVFNEVKKLKSIKNIAKQQTNIYDLNQMKEHFTCRNTQNRQIIQKTILKKNCKLHKRNIDKHIDWNQNSNSKFQHEPDSTQKQIQDYSILKTQSKMKNFTRSLRRAGIQTAKKAEQPKFFDNKEPAKNIQTQARTNTKMISLDSPAKQEVFQKTKIVKSMKHINRQKLKYTQKNQYRLSIN